jgi:hypothetical protein
MIVCQAVTNHLSLLLPFFAPNYTLPSSPGSHAPGELLLSKQYQNSNYKSFPDALQSFLLEAGKVTGDSTLPQILCLAVAGPVNHNRCTLTNRNWVIDGNLLQEKLGAMLGVPLQGVRVCVCVSVCVCVCVHICGSVHAATPF